MPNKLYFKKRDAASSSSNASAHLSKLIKTIMRHHHFCLLLVGILALSGCSSEEGEAFAYAEKQNNLAALDSFMEVYPNGSYLQEALKRKEWLHWEKAKYEGTVFYYKKYLLDYPQGEYLQAAMDSLQVLQPTPLDFTKLLELRFVGLIDYGDVEKDVLSMRFTHLNVPELDSVIQFKANINLPDIRKDLEGHINKNNNRIHFKENENDKVKINLSAGRLYFQKGQLVIESVEPKQYWRLRQ